MAETTTKRESKKSFFDVKAPMTSAKISLYAGSAQELHGKVIKLDLSRSLRGKGLEMRMRVVASGDELNAEPICLEIAGSHIRRMMRKGADYVEDSFVAQCKDGKVIVKPFMITRKKVSRAVRNTLRVAAKQHLEAHFTTRTSKELFNEIMTNKLLKDLSLKLKKIYPLSVCEIRVFKLVENKPSVK